MFRKSMSKLSSVLMSNSLFIIYLHFYTHTHKHKILHIYYLFYVLTVLYAGDSKKLSKAAAGGRRNVGVLYSQPPL